jgi:hypothetical protein
MQCVNGEQQANVERQHRDMLLGLAAEFLSYCGDALKGDGGDPRAIRKMQVVVYRLWRSERRKFALQYLNATPAEDAVYRAKCKLFDGPGAVDDFKCAEAAFDHGQDLFVGLHRN